MKLLKLTFLLMLFCTFNQGFAQNDYATLIIYRPAKFKMSAVKALVNINGTNAGIVKNGGKLEYKLFTTGQVIIDITGNNQNFINANNDFDKKTRLRINTQNGQNYYVKLNPKHQITTGYFEIEQTKNIKNKLKSKIFVFASEFDFLKIKQFIIIPKQIGQRQNFLIIGKRMVHLILKGFTKKLEMN